MAKAQTEFDLGVIGAGNMAEAILRGAVAARFLKPGRIVASDPSAERRRFLADRVGVRCEASNRIPAACPRVLLAVKPQVLERVLEEIAPVLRDDAVVVSIAAGIPTSFLDARLGGRGRIVRAMPNTPMLVGCGVSALCPGPRAAEADLRWAEKLFSACGRAVRVTEGMMDAVTAVSGSGPAYFFYLLEAMTAAGVIEGLPESVAAELAAHTCQGAASLVLQTGESPHALRAKVTSPGGTTQRAIETLDAAGVKDKLIQAVRAAAQRSRELGR